MNTRLIIAAVTVALIVASAAAGYRAGINAQLARQQKAVQKYQKRVETLLAELDAERQKRKVVVREKIRVVKETADPTGCADSDIPDAIYQQLR